MENKNQHPKYILYIEYRCDTDFGPKDGWIIYEGERIPQLGEDGFGKVNCLNYASIQSCELTNCRPSRGIVSAMELYSPERARELGLEKTLH